MPLISKISPVGIDKFIDRIQTYVYNEVTWDTGTTYEANHRAYKNETADGLIPEVFNPTSKDYQEMYFNDNVDASSFFIVSDTRSGDKMYTSTVSMIFQLKLSKIFPGVPHRADEEAHVTILNILERNPYGLNVTGLTTGISNVYTGMRVDHVKYDDMQQFHVFKVDMEVNFENC